MLELAPPPLEAEVFSPELALVDDELRVLALAELPSVEPFEFLQLRDLPAPAEPRAARRFTAGLVYLVVAILRTCVFNACVFASVALVVLGLSLLG